MAKIIKDSDLKTKKSTEPTEDKKSIEPEKDKKLKTVLFGDKEYLAPINTVFIAVNRKGEIKAFKSKPILLHDTWSAGHSSGTQIGLMEPCDTKVIELIERGSVKWALGVLREIMVSNGASFKHDDYSEAVSVIADELLE